MFAVCTTALGLILAFPPFDVGWIAWIALIPWLFELERSGPRRAFLLSVLTGLLFFAGTLWWVGHVTIPGMLILVAYLALYFGVWGWLAGILLRRGGTWKVLLGLPAAWVALEYIRSHLFSGFGWNLLAYTQWKYTRLIWPAGWIGAYGISFLLVWLNEVLYRIVRQSRSLLKNVMILLLVSGVLGGLYFVGGVSERARFSGSGSTLKVALLQGNVPQTEKWDEAFQEAIWKRYEELMAKAVQLKPDLIVWPETAVPGYWEDPAIEERLTELSRSAGIEMLVGLPTEDPESGLPYNSALLLGRDGKEQARYSKIHLVPFGEFIPIKPLFGWLKKFYPVADFTPGKQWTVFRGAAKGCSVLICFEDLFPELCRGFVRRGAQWFLVITNDAWFGRSAASLQHLQASVFRAVENGVWIGRSANNGWTGFIDPKGRLLPFPGQLPRFKPGVAFAEIQIPADIGRWSEPGRTYYVCWGYGFPLLCLGLAAWALFPSRRRL